MVCWSFSHGGGQLPTRSDWGQLISMPHLKRSLRKKYSWYTPTFTYLPHRHKHVHDIFLTHDCNPWLNCSVTMFSDEILRKSETPHFVDISNGFNNQPAMTNLNRQDAGDFNVNISKHPVQCPLVLMNCQWCIFHNITNMITLGYYVGVEGCPVARALRSRLKNCGFTYKIVTLFWPL